jgi:hypothetical protein
MAFGKFRLPFLIKNLFYTSSPDTHIEQNFTFF